MAHDLIIRRGTVVDGTGVASTAADVAIDSGRITTVGVVDEPGREELDARGMYVTPGFVDLHTHYDAQVGWDPLLTPSSWHGVTTALLGNCGMTFAPVRPGEARRLADMMETVEDIPAQSIMSALPWSWESYGDYLDFVETAAPALNVAGMVGHCAVRYYVMGDGAVDGEPSPAEIAQMAELVADALDRGAAGFSTSRFLGHVLKDRRNVPGTFASGEELAAIAGVMRGRGLVEAVLNAADLDADIDLMTEIGRITGGHLLITAVTVEGADLDGTGPTTTTGIKQPTPPLVDRAVAGGADLWATLLPREGGSIVGLFARLPWRTPAWTGLSELPHEARLAAIADSSTRRQLVTEAASARPMVSTKRLFFMGDDVANYMQAQEFSLAGLAAAAGEEPAETFLRMSLESEGRAMFAAVSFNRDAEVLRRLLLSERFLPGLGDAGAHLNGVMDASYSTFVLSHWSRDSGALSLGEAVRRLTSAPADLLGVADRGRLVPGAAADINVIDLVVLASLPPETVRDAPLGATRLIQRSRGYKATLVNGEPIVVDGVHTGRRPGSVLRSFSGV